MDQATMDNLMAQRIVHYLITPINQWEAFRVGIIDAEGKIKRQPKPTETPIFNFFHVIVIRLRNLLKTSGKGTSWVLPTDAGKFYLGQNMAPTNFTNWSVSNQSNLPIHNLLLSTFKECIERNDDTLLETFVGLLEDGEVPSMVGANVEMPIVPSSSYKKDNLKRTKKLKSLLGLKD